MTQKRSVIETILLIGIILAAPARAGTDRSFPQIEAISLVNVTGVIRIEVGGDAVSVNVIDGKPPYALDVNKRGSELVISGPKRSRHYYWRKDVGSHRDHDEAFRRYLADYPVVTIKAPAGLDLLLEDVIALATVGALHGDLAVRGGHVEAVFGDMKRADIEIGGAGDIAMGAVEDDLRVSIGGSGDFEAVSAGIADIIVAGSGDVVLGPVNGETAAAIFGSGDVTLSSVNGPLKASINGSGNASAAEVRGGADLSIAGSGDISLKSVNGPTQALISGNGDIGISDGYAEDLKVRIAGSGDFVFGGASTNLNASISGSGLVSVRSNDGNLTRRGRGEVMVGGKQISRGR